MLFCHMWVGTPNCNLLRQALCRVSLSNVLCFRDAYFPDNSPMMRWIFSSLPLQCAEGAVLPSR